MAAVTIERLEALTDLVGDRVGPTDWVAVTQADIDSFAELSRDHQWIHVDAERAASESPFGKTIAHGNLTLALIDGFREQLIEQRGTKMGINYGWNKVRFPAPVPVDSRVRAFAEVIEAEQLDGGWWNVVTRFTVERDGEEKPVCVAESVVRLLAE